MRIVGPRSLALAPHSLALFSPAEGNQEEVAQDDISMTEKSETDVVNILVKWYDRNIKHVMDSRQYQPC